LTKLRGGTQLHAGDAVTYLPEHTWHVETGYAASNTNLLLFVDGVSRVPRAVARPGIAGVPYVSRYKGGEVSRVYQSWGNSLTVAPAYAMLGIRAQHRVRKTMDVTVQVENLTNRFQNDDAMQSPVLGRQVSLGVRFRH
jgi:hypothetical protein